MIDIVIILLIIQGAIGAFDVFYNHEWDAQLPKQPSAKLELKIHSIRSMLYAFVFLGIAWFEWHGSWVFAFGGLLLIEIFLTLWDFVIEDKTRKLSPVERVVHTVLAMNGGAYVGFMVYIFVENWIKQPTALHPVSYGWSSWILTVYAVGVFLSGVREGLASRNLKSL
jgi:hypothetical protein